MMMLMMRKEEKEKDMLSEKSDNPNLKCGEKRLSKRIWLRVYPEKALLQTWFGLDIGLDIVVYLKSPRRRLEEKNINKTLCSRYRCVPKIASPEARKIIHEQNTLLMMQMKTKMKR